MLYNEFYMKKNQSLCDWKRSDIENNQALLQSLVIVPKFFCRKCARVANSKKVLCKPSGF